MNKEKKYGAAVISVLVSAGPSAMNCDDLGDPKTAPFGGTLRDRLASQALKRAWRICEAFKACFGETALRTRMLPDMIADELSQKGYSEEFTSLVRDILVADGYSDKVDFYSKAEVASFSQNIIDAWKKCGENIDTFRAKYAGKTGGGKDSDGDSGTKKRGRSSKKADETKKKKSGLLKKAGVPMTVDQAFWGRMATSDHIDTIEGAVSVAHALSTGPCGGNGSPDFDYFVCVDDVDPMGAGHIGETGFVSSCYYICARIDLDLLYENLSGHDNRDEIMEHVIGNLTQIMMTVLPSGHQHTFFTATYPEAVYVYHTMSKANAVTLVNAFAKAITGTNVNYDSVKALSAYVDNMNHRFFVPDHQAWLVTMDEYADLTPTAEGVEIAQTADQLKTALNSWIKA